jgi:hypothetical protein
MNNTYRPFLAALACTILVSLTSVWIVNAVAPAPYHQENRGQQSFSSRHFQISPIPPGADWTA